ncbi:P-loop ATPase, Sll1717 family [Rhodococcus sp. NBC_00294]|uniref:P-loop ATPase, Sll1717 family n=1 Tax=Rhodococcus sp. NBC_00294 TaxID=2976004 RepID=UPI002E2DF0E8|nr:hypothetical protein [Rhodococcus sp. NBC_00294]
MLVRDLLAALDLGSSVAEHDDLLERYFVETETFNIVINDRADIIAGDKGTGKSALYRILSQRYSDIPELANVEVVSAFNIKGTPVFQTLEAGDLLEESDYVRLWKTYFVALAGNWLLELLDEYEYSPQLRWIEEVLKKNGLRTPDDTPKGVFARIVQAIRRSINIKTATASVKTVGFEVDASVDFFEKSSNVEGVPLVEHALSALTKVLDEQEISIWLAVDRLDEAFQGRPAVETPALRGLLRAYLDMQEYQALKLKIFVRRDLFGRIIQGGFVNLTHINARKVEIIWDDADLSNLLSKRVSENTNFLKMLDARPDDAETHFDALFPEKVDRGDRKPLTWNWILSRIGDSNVKPPRNLIDLVNKARESQLRAENRTPRLHEEGEALITSEALKLGLDALSQERVQDTLLAEAGEYSEIILGFRGGKAEQNLSSLSAILGEHSQLKIDYLASIGFLEKTGATYKIPMLYRGGLQISQGKAF